MKNRIIRLMLAAALVGYSQTAKVAAEPAAARTITFAVPNACPCAQCSFDVYRVIGKFEGVKKVRLEEDAHRLSVDFAEDKQPISALAAKLAQLDSGKGSSLLWSPAKGVDATKTAAALSQLPGIAGAKADVRQPVIHVTFAPSPAVSLRQLDLASPGGN